MKVQKLYSILLLLCCCCSLQAQHLRQQPVLDTLSFAYQETGSREETLILLHGLGGTHKHWMRNLEGLSKHYRVLAVDLPGYGASTLSSLPEGNLLLYFSDALLALMDSLSIPKAHLLGHSMGGQLAALFALEHPERVNKLILAAPAGIETFTAQEAARLNAYAAAAFPQKQTAAQVQQAWAMNFTQLPAEAAPLIQERLQLQETDYYPTYTQVLIGGVAGMLAAPIADRLHSLQLPTLLLFGAEDKLIPNRLLHPNLSTAQLAEQAKAALPNSKLVLLPAAGHLLQFEQPAAFNQAVLSFLQHKPSSKKSTP